MKILPTQTAGKMAAGAHPSHARSVHPQRESWSTSKRLWRVYLTMLSPLVLVTLVGAVPLEKGRTVTVGTGYTERSVYQGCTGPTPYVKGVPLYASYRERLEDNVVVSSDAAVSMLRSDVQGHSDEAEDISENGAYVSGSIRLGYGGERGGIELGPSLRWTSLQKFEISNYPLLWSVSFWAGKPDLLYFFGRSLAGYESPQSIQALGMIGLGQKRSWYEAELSIPWWLPVLLYSLDSPAQSSPAAELHIGVRASQRLWLAVDLGLGPYRSYEQHTDLQALLSLSWRPVPLLAPGIQRTIRGPTVPASSVSESATTSPPIWVPNP